jgi:hypothetical protein
MDIKTMQVVQKVNGLTATINVSDFDEARHVDPAAPVKATEKAVKEVAEVPAKATLPRPVRGGGSRA